MKVQYTRIMAADCTSDPHPVSYGGEDNMLQAMLEDIIRVCESDMVQHVESVRGAVDDIEYASDTYGDCDLYKRGKGQVTTEQARKHKIHGLYFWSDPEFSEDDKAGKHLPPGLTGAKELAKVMLANPDKVTRLSIGVTWKFAGSSSCSDYIEINGEYSGPNQVNYGSQDWWIENKGYLPWCEQMEEFLSKPFPRSTPEN
jgi:hypothetical protein